MKVTCGNCAPLYHTRRPSGWCCHPDCIKSLMSRDSLSLRLLERHKKGTIGEDSVEVP